MLTTIFAVILGIILVLSFAIPIVYISTKKSSEFPPAYDERQILARNRSYKLGFIVMTVFNVICIFIPLIAEECGYQRDWWELSTIMFCLSLFFGWNAFTISAILQDAYDKLTDSGWSSGGPIGGLVFGLIWILNGIRCLHNGDELLSCLPAFLFGSDAVLLSLVGFIHTRRHAHDDDEDDAEEK